MLLCCFHWPTCYFLYFFDLPSILATKLVSHWEWVRSALNGHAIFREMERERERSQTAHLLESLYRPRCWLSKRTRTLEESEDGGAYAMGHDGDIV